jgi:hypothetical protein
MLDIMGKVVLEEFGVIFQTFVENSVNINDLILECIEIHNNKFVAFV